MDKYGNKYKVYIKDNEEHFEVWYEGDLVRNYIAPFTQTLCDYIELTEEEMKMVISMISTALSKHCPAKEKETIFKRLCSICPAYLFLEEEMTQFIHTYSWYETDTEILDNYHSMKSYFANAIYGDDIEEITINHQLNIGVESIDSEICTVLYPNSVTQVLVFLFIQMLSSNVNFKVCKRCLKIFPCHRNKHIAYCDRYDTSLQQTCRETGLQYSGQETYIDKNVADLRTNAIRLFNSAYSKQRRKIKSGSISKDDFKIWSATARQKRDYCIEFKLSLDEFEKWLKENENNYEYEIE